MHHCLRVDECLCVYGCTMYMMCLLPVEPDGGIYLPYSTYISIVKEWIWNGHLAATEAVKIKRAGDATLSAAPQGRAHNSTLFPSCVCVYVEVCVCVCVCVRVCV